MVKMLANIALEVTWVQSLWEPLMKTIQCHIIPILESVLTCKLLFATTIKTSLFFLTTTNPILDLHQALISSLFGIQATLLPIP